ncbi:MerR family DNA-binding transcriptional regulator [Paenibacillaceae bacterium]|nr:MerR family DNA-binding transcriptional regulator [Paenibacillaceae bacterium]
MIRVGELAKKANISKRTLYYYEQIELLQPTLVSENGYRYYDENAVLHLLRSTIHTIQLKGTSDMKDLLQVIVAMNDRPLVEGVVPAEFSDDLPLTSREMDILNRLPVLGSNDKRMEELLIIFGQVRCMMPSSPYSSEAQVIAGQLYEKELDLFDGDEKLLD